jgi:fibronectin type III domain protein
MSTRQISRLIIFTAAFAFSAVLLFSGQTVSSASKGDRSAPTVPANLTVTGITDWTVSLKWQPSTDNSGKFSYRVRINNLNNSAYNQLATVAQTQTTYTVKYLSSNSNYTFSVYAVDDAGNKSADSNIASAQTLADTTPPTGLALQATVLTPSQVKLTWTTATDDVPSNCCNYGINLNGARITQNVNWLSQTSATIRHLQPGTGYSFSVTASDFSGGNATTSNAVDLVTLPSSDTLPPTVPTNVHLVRDDSCAEIWLGWTESSDASDSQVNIEYEIYVNGVLSPLPVATGVDFDFVYGTAFGDNYFTIRAVDRSGNSSAPSTPIKLFLWPC